MQTKDQFLFLTMCAIIKIFFILFFIFFITMMILRAGVAAAQWLLKAAKLTAKPNKPD